MMKKIQVKQMISIFLYLIMLFTIIAFLVVNFT